MIKNYFILILLAIGSLNLSAINYTSAQNGNWTNPLSWSPIGIPIPGDNAIINHAIVLDTSLAYTVGTVTVNAVGSVTQDFPVRSIWLNGPNAVYTNNGLTTVKNLLLSAGSFTNSGDFNANIIGNYLTLNNTGTGVMMGVDSMYNDGIITNNGMFRVGTFFNNNTINNYGTIQGLSTLVDSMYNAGTFLNDVSALLIVDSCTNANNFTNNGIINFNEFTNVGVMTNTNYVSFDDMTNTGTFTNQDSLIGTGSLTNTGNLDNQSGATIDLGISFLNMDLVSFNALLTINGLLNIGDSYYNFDAVTGTSTGSIVLQDSSYNSGTMTGDFDFCDMTPPGASPFIDFNSGTVDVNITYCTGVGILAHELASEITIYPNPTNGIISVQSDEIITVDVFNVLGEKILTTKNHRIDLSRYQKGIYFIKLKDKNGEVLRSERILKY